MMRLLVSVRSVREALAAAQAGAHFIDLKEPAAGALGGLPPRRIARIVQALRMVHPAAPISATIGDVPVASRGESVRRVEAVAACRVDYVKVGIALAPHADAEPALALLEGLARCDAAIVPVLLVDDGIDDRVVDAVLQARVFPALMLDTVDKRAGSLLQRLPADALAAFVARARAHGCLVGLAGALRAVDVAALAALAPDFAGFRSAVCDGDRAGALDPKRVRDLVSRFADPRPVDRRAA